ncbi:hypothetical protein C8R43DRAFT_1121095 [Mycena crocata]|nr:hypothetical protein C8R43DRAFT_1121095 [Mycena crocata]
MSYSAFEVPKRVQVACAHCRARKIKCITESQQKTCMRCQHNGLDCEYIPLTKNSPSSRAKRTNKDTRGARKTSASTPFTSHTPSNHYLDEDERQSPLSPRFGADGADSAHSPDFMYTPLCDDLAWYSEDRRPSPSYFVQATFQPSSYLNVPLHSTTYSAHQLDPIEQQRFTSQSFASCGDPMQDCHPASPSL